MNEQVKKERLSIKDTLIEEAIHQPIEFAKDVSKREALLDEITFYDLRNMIKRIYDLNDDMLKETSNGNAGMMGRFNKMSTAARTKKYYKRIKEKIALQPDSKIIVAEGDSWFQFPVFIKDIIDWLNDNEHFAIYSMAYAGDWLTNIIYEEKYIPELSIHRPDVFLISGGGNDLVGGNRLTLMVSPARTGCIRRSPFELERIRSEDHDLSEEDINTIIHSQEFLTREFYAFINVLNLQYRKVVRNLDRANKLNKPLILTHGYDYAIPSWKYHFSWRYPLQPVVNWLVSSGRWLKRPLRIRGVEEKWHANLVKVMIFEVNQTFKSIAREEAYEHIYHIDCRNVAQSRSDWFDELHLKSNSYKKIARAYEMMIDGSIRQHPQWNDIAKSKTIRAGAL